MTAHINMLSSRINKGKAPKEVSAAISDLKDLADFHQNMPVAMGTALQHLVDSLCAHMANLILLHRDSYQKHVKNGIKPDTYNHLRNAPLFGHGLFPDAVIRTAEQDIASYQTTGPVPRPGPGAAQQTGWRLSHRYRPYDTKESRPTGTGDPEQQTWRQFGWHRAWGRGRGRGSNPLNPGATSIINDNYLLRSTFSNKVLQRLDKRVVRRTFQTVEPKVVDSSILSVPKTQKSTSLNLQSASYLAVSHVHSACFQGLPQKKGTSPFVSKIEIKDIKSVSCVSQSLSVPHVHNAPSVVPNLAVGGRLQKFWQT